MPARASFPSRTRAALRPAYRRLRASKAGPLVDRIRHWPRSVRRSIGFRLAGAALALGGPDVLGLGAGTSARSSWGNLPKAWQVTPRPAPADKTWPDPPDVDDAARVTHSIYETGDRPPVMDLALMESLNEEYASHPLVPAPNGLDQASREERARRRLLEVHDAIDLQGKKVLELGCGPGFEVWYLSHKFGADAWGVDVAERKAWAVLEDDRTHYRCVDIADGSGLDADSFDRVISFSVLEHVVHPHAVIAELYRILKPGGLIWLSANLHRGPKASHIFREVYFPFPHLLFSDDVIRQFRESHGGKAAGASWVNRLTWSQYEDYMRQTGFIIRSLRFSEQPIDEGFYERFGDILGRYPRWDLSRDFFHVVLEKPAGPRAG